MVERECRRAIPDRVFSHETVERNPLYTQRSLDNFAETVLYYLESNPITSGCPSLPRFAGLFCPTCTHGLFNLMLTMLTGGNNRLDFRLGLA